MDETNHFGGRNRAVTVLVAGIVVASLGVAGVAVSNPSVTSVAAQSQGSSVVAVGNATTSPGGSATIDLTLSNAPEGVSGYDLVVRLANPGVGNVTGASVADEFGLTRAAVGENNATATLSGVDIDENVQSGATNVQLGTVELTGVSAGTTRVVVEAVNLDDDNGTAVDPETTPGTLTVQPADDTATTTGTTTTATTTETATPTIAVQTETTDTAQPTDTDTAQPTDTDTAQPTDTDTAQPTDTDTAQPTDTETTETPGDGGSSGTSGSEAGTSGDGTVDGAAVADSLARSGLSDAQVETVSRELAASGLSDVEVTAITDALAGDGLADDQRRAVADAIAGGNLTDRQVRALADALSDGRLTETERDALGFLEAGASGAASATAYYQVDLVTGEPIENLRGPNGTYSNDELVRFAHGSTDQPVMRRSEGEFTTDDAVADAIESHDITVANGTATATFTVADGESVELSLVSYEKVGPGWSPRTEAEQEFVDSDTETFDSGTHTLTVDLPDENDSTDE